MIVLSCPGCTREDCVACGHRANRGRRGLRVDPDLCTECDARLVGAQQITCTSCTFASQGSGSGADALATSALPLPAITTRTAA
jgi:hypothetical protein